MFLLKVRCAALISCNYNIYNNIINIITDYEKQNIINENLVINYPARSAPRFDFQLKYLYKIKIHHIHINTNKK